MVNISLLSRLVNGVQRQVDLSSNTLVVQAIQINGTLLSSSGATAGSTLVGDNDSYSYFTPSAATVKGALQGIDTALGSIGGDAITSLTGDVTASGPGAAAATLATVNTNVGSFGSSTSIPSFTVNGKGLITAASGNAVVAPAGTLSGTTLNSTVVSSSLTYVGTLTSGTWHASAIGPTYGGTGLTSYSAGDLLYASATNTLSALAATTDGYVLTLASGLPSWAAPAYAGTVTSVAFADDSTAPIYTVSGSPVTSSGTLAITLNTQAANSVFAGPSSGAAAQPSFRALVSADIPDLSSVYLPLAGGTMSGNINMGGQRINNLSDPSSAGDAATKNYVDSAINGLTWKGPVQAYSDANVALTGGSTLTVDSYSVQNGDYVILANQTTASENYVYVASGIGTAYTLTEVTGSEAPTAIGDAYLILNGTVYGNTAFQVNAISPNVTFIQFAGPNTYSFSAPLSLAGNVVSLDYSNGLTLSGSALVVEASNSSITVASGGISVALSASGAILNSSGLYVNLNAANPGLAITSNALDVKYNTSGAIIATSSGIAVQVDNSTVAINGSNQLSVPSAGIGATQLGNQAVTAAKLSTGAFDQSTIIGGAGTPASVANAPAIQFAGVAGQTFDADTTYALRFGLPQNSETAGRLYAADITTSSYDLFWVVGFLPSGAGFTAGEAISVVKFGVLTLGSSDTDFVTNDGGKPIYLQSGGINASTTPPSTAGQAVAKLGIAMSTSSFLADIGSPSVY